LRRVEAKDPKALAFRRLKRTLSEGVPQERRMGEGNSQ
jgi:hypothetical protein